MSEPLLPYSTLTRKSAPKMRASKIKQRSTSRQPTKFRTAWGWQWPNGREVCDLRTAAGKHEYAERREQMASRQDYRCCFCGQYMSTWEVTFEHENGRGAGKRDDRITDAQGNPMNKAAHGSCNAAAGSPKRKAKGAANAG